MAERVGFRTQLRRRDGRLSFSRTSACASSGGRFAPLCLLATPLPPNPKGHLAMPLLVWRRVWDSNPRGIAPKRFSRPPRYDHFDNSPYSMYEKNAVRQPCPPRSRRRSDRKYNLRSPLPRSAGYLFPKTAHRALFARSPVMTASITLHTVLFYHSFAGLSIDFSRILPDRATFP